MGIAVITLADVQQWIPMITALLVVAFDWGILYARIKTFVNKEDVNKMLEEKLKSHCPNVAIIRSIDLKVQNLEEWKIKHTEWGNKSNEENHLVLQELRINMKRLCEHSGIDYLNGNK